MTKHDLTPPLSGQKKKRLPYIEYFLLGSAPEDIRLEVGLVERGLDLAGARDQVIGPLARNHLARLVKRLHPGRARLISDVRAHHIAVVGFWERLVAFLAPPLLVHVLGHLLVTTLGWAGRVVEGRLGLGHHHNRGLDLKVQLLVGVQVRGRHRELVHGHPGRSAAGFEIRGV